MAHFTLSTLKTIAFDITGASNVAGLKAALAALNPLYTGDFRRKQTWLDAIEVIANEWADDGAASIGGSAYTAQSVDYMVVVSHETYGDLWFGSEDGSTPFGLTFEQSHPHLAHVFSDSETLVKDLARAMDATDAILAEYGGSVDESFEGWEAGILGSVKPKSQQLPLFDVEQFSLLAQLADQEVEVIEPKEQQLTLFGIPAVQLTGWDRVAAKSFEDLLSDCRCYGLIRSTPVSMTRGDLLELLWEN